MNGDPSSSGSGWLIQRTCHLTDPAKDGSPRHSGRLQSPVPSSGHNLDSRAGWLHTGVVRKLAWSLAGLAAASLALGMLAVVLSQGDVALEIGRGLLTLGTASVIAGLVSVLIRQVEDRRAKRSAGGGMLPFVIGPRQAGGIGRLVFRPDRAAGTQPVQRSQLGPGRGGLDGGAPLRAV